MIGISCILPGRELSYQFPKCQHVGRVRSLQTESTEGSHQAKQCDICETNRATLDGTFSDFFLMFWVASNGFLLFDDG